MPSAERSARRRAPAVLTLALGAGLLAAPAAPAQAAEAPLPAARYTFDQEDMASGKITDSSGNGLTAQGPASTEIHGRDVCTGLARSVRVDTAAVRDAIQTPLTAILDGIGKVLRSCPPDLVADLADRGIMMVGGSALLPGLDQMLRQATGMPVHIAERPDVCAVQGLGAMLEGRIAPLALDPLST